MSTDFWVKPPALVYNATGFSHELADADGEWKDFTGSLGVLSGTTVRRNKHCWNLSFKSSGLYIIVHFHLSSAYLNLWCPWTVSAVFFAAFTMTAEWQTRSSRKLIETRFWWSSWHCERGYARCLFPYHSHTGSYKWTVLPSHKHRKGPLMP